MKTEINLIIQNKELTYKTKLTNLLNIKGLPHLLKVKFAYQCALNLEQYYNKEKYPEVYKTRQICLELLANYILNPTKDKIKDLKNAANTANAAAYTAYTSATTTETTMDSAYAAAYAAYATSYAAYAAIANTAFTAADVAHAASCSTNAFKKETKYTELYYKLLFLLNKEYNLGFNNEMLESLYL